jgi:hypothetical protein
MAEKLFGNLTEIRKKALVFHVNTEIFNGIKSGKRKEIFKPADTRWARRLKKQYEHVIIIRGTPKNDTLNETNTIVLSYRGFCMKEICYGFVEKPKEVFSISVRS